MGDMDYILTSGFDSVRPVIFHVDVKRKPRLFKFIFFTTNMLNLIVFFLYIDRESFSAKTSSEDVCCSPGIVKSVFVTSEWRLSQSPR